MWLFTKHGFYSVVKKPFRDSFRSTGNPHPVTFYQIRARVHSHLEALKKLTRIKSPIIEGGATDYKFRVVVSPRVWKRIGPILVSAAEIDYANFKSEVARKLGYGDKYEKALHRVWSIMNELQKEKREEPKPLNESAYRPIPNGCNFGAGY